MDDKKEPVSDVTAILAIANDFIEGQEIQFKAMSNRLKFGVEVLREKLADRNPPNNRLKGDNKYHSDWGIVEIPDYIYQVLDAIDTSFGAELSVQQRIAYAAANRCAETFYFKEG